jgi:hypothetical protein
MKTTSGTSSFFIDETSMQKASKQAHGTANNFL